MNKETLSRRTKESTGPADTNSKRSQSNWYARGLYILWAIIIIQSCCNLAIIILHSNRMKRTEGNVAALLSNFEGLCNHHEQYVDAVDHKLAIYEGAHG